MKLATLRAGGADGTLVLVDRALRFVKRVEQIVVAALDREGTTTPVQGELIPFPARFLRPTDHFTHRKEET
jgi:hypothetical protein